MESVLALVIGVLGGAGVWLVLRPRTFQVIMGLALLSSLFGEVPGPWTLAGAAIVVAATLLITLREQQLARSAKLRAEPEAER